MKNPNSITETIALIVFVVWAASLAGTAIFASECNATRGNIGRETQRCEAAGAEYGCISHSARTRSGGYTCWCVLRPASGQRAAGTVEWPAVRVTP